LKETVIVITGLKKSFGDRTVLNGFELELYRGENLVVLGKSGTGKSVLIKCIIGLLRPDDGRIEVFGQNVPDLSLDELDQLRVKIGFLFQSNALYDSMTVRENLEFPLRRTWIQMDHDEVDKLVAKALEDVGLGHTVDMMPAELSGGMRKRIALARTLILNPAIMLYDEPTTGLDSVTSREIIGLMKEVQEKYRTSSLIITHDMKCVEHLSDRVVILLDGRCYAVGTYPELKDSPDERIRQFFE
jgi:phospholipid/cholesterol/gamma-HCH transport system ATP-binding protein